MGNVLRHQESHDNEDCEVLCLSLLFASHLLSLQLHYHKLALVFNIAQEQYILYIISDNIEELNHFEP